MKKTVFNRFLVFAGALLCLFPLRAEKSKGELTNLVCFVRFQDETETEAFEHPDSWYEQLFNDSSAGANSVYNYFREASYGQLSWTSSFFPFPTNGKVVSYQARYERGFYREKGEINAIGYEDEIDKAAREQALIREIAGYLSAALPDDMVLDADGNGAVDNLCIVLSGRSELGSSHLLWPHRSDLALPDGKAIYIKGKKLVGYLMVFDDANGWSSLSPVPLNTGVLCHEMSHSLGTYDLYHVNDNLNPVGVWDLMSDNLTTPQQMSAYTKWRYCGWLDGIPEISEPGTYSLHPVGGVTAENTAYKIHPVGSDEYFVVEYRKKEGTFDSGLPESGLLVYRINPAYVGGNVNYNGTTRLDEVYIFRPGGTAKADGNIEKAAFSAESGRTAFGGDKADVKPFYSDGSPARFALTQISDCGETISFRLEQQGHIVSLSVPEKVTLAGAAGEKLEFTVEADVDWTVADVPAWLRLTPASGGAGKTTVVLETLSENGEAQEREAALSFTSPSDEGVRTVLTVRQQSRLILPPSGLTAQATDDGHVQLRWSAPLEGVPVLSDGFEDTSNPNGWTLRNEPGGRGWTWQEDARKYEAYEGSYSMYMKSAWEDLHQDEHLVSPLFANGRTLTFYSRSIAPNKTVRNQHYYVEVSRDGGQTWAVVYDLMKDCDVVNQWVKVTVDISPYQSEEMQVAFHAYDETDIGLSYWWQVDNVAVYPATDGSMVEGYVVYRNGVKIGETTDCTFTDTDPQAGENVYTVRATGAFGETSDSETASYASLPDGVNAVSGLADLEVTVAGGRLTVRSASPLQRIRIVSLSGVEQAVLRPSSAVCEADLSGWPRGMYVAVCEAGGGAAPVVRKFVVK